jgi:hypothetical protein
MHADPGASLESAGGLAGNADGIRVAAEGEENMSEAPKPEPLPWWRWLSVLPILAVCYATEMALADWEFWPRLLAVLVAAFATALVIAAIVLSLQRLSRGKRPDA